MLKLKAKGYTLIEVLAALAIFVIIVGIISFTFIQILKNIDLVKQKEERLSDIQAMLTVIQFDLSQVIEKADIQKGTNQPKGSFYTLNNLLHFCKTGNINPDDQFKRSSLEEIEYYIENNQLIKKFKNDENNAYKTQLLLDQVQQLKWVFYDAKLGQYTNWPPTQDWAYTTPIAIKLTIVLKDYGEINKTIDMAHHE